MNLNIGLLLGESLLARETAIFFKNFKKKEINIKFIQSNLSMKEYLKKNIFKKKEYISNKQRNENTIIKLIKKKKINLILSIQHPWILSEKVIKANSNIFNCHFGKLPNYRGHDPINFAILNGEKYCFSSLHLISDKVDTGYLVSEKKILIKLKNPREIEKLMVKQFLAQIKSLVLKKTKNKKITLKPIKKFGIKFNRLDSIKKIKKVKNLNKSFKKIQALNHAPHEPAYIKINGKKIFLLTNYSEYLNYRGFKK